MVERQCGPLAHCQSTQGSIRAGFSNGIELDSLLGISVGHTPLNLWGPDRQLRSSRWGKVGRSSFFSSHNVYSVVEAASVIQHWLDGEGCFRQLLGHLQRGRRQTQHEFIWRAGWLPDQTNPGVCKLKRGCDLSASTYHMVLRYSLKFDLRMLVSTFS